MPLPDRHLMLSLDRVAADAVGASLQELDLHCRDGEWVLLTGLPRSARSLLQDLILGRAKPTRGSVEVLGFDPCAMPATVQDELVSNRADEATVVPSLHPLLWHALGGDRDAEDGVRFERAALFRALCRPARLLLLDDPLSALDADGRCALRAALRKRRRDGTGGVVLAEHPGVWSPLVDRVLIWDGGRCIGQYPARRERTAMARIGLRAEAGMRLVWPMSELLQLDREGGAWRGTCPAAWLPDLLATLQATLGPAEPLRITLGEGDLRLPAAA